MKAAFANIGVFTDDANRPGADFLARSDLSCASIDFKAVQSIFAQFGIAPGGCFTVIPTLVLESGERKKLITELDALCNGESDFKLPLTEDELGELIGSEHVQRLSSCLPAGCNQIYLRRCCAHGRYIGFHVDEAQWTLQVALNDPDEYEGGRLIYATEDFRVARPHRAAGTATLHDGFVLHGVTKLQGGVRYSLYLLQLDPEYY